ncbi:MAG: CvpA family protein [Candidatus Riflebacteria bacterium]|nr:CvpA family protein [Candidatus Riflebacteria bacterium]
MTSATDPRPSAPPPAIDPSEVRQSRFEPVVTFAWLATLGLIAARWSEFPSVTEPLNLATMATALYFGWKASLDGGLWELLSIAQLAGGVAVGYLGKDFFAGLFGFPGLLGGVFGFYAGFLFTYLGLALLKYLCRDRSRLPGPAMRALGLVLGAAEGVLLVGIVGFALALLDTSAGAGGPGGPRPLAPLLVGQVIGPLVPPSASGAIELARVAQEMRRGFDPSRVDREALTRQFAPVTGHPRLQEAANDPELRALAEKGDPLALLQHPKVRALLSDGELVRLAGGIDLHEVARLLRQGLVPGAGTGPGAVPPVR